MVMNLAERDRISRRDALCRAWADVRATSPATAGELRAVIGDGVPFDGRQRLCLVRHGETVTNALGLVTGTLDVHLTDRGRTDAVAAGRKLTDYHFATAWSSRLERSRETCSILLEAAGSADTPRILDDRLAERSLGVMEGRKRRHVPEFAAGDMTFAPPRGESYASVGLRIMAFLLDLARLPAEFQGDALVATHMGPLRMIDAVLAHPDATPAEVLGRSFENTTPFCRPLSILRWPQWLRVESTDLVPARL